MKIIIPKPSPRSPSGGRRRVDDLEHGAACRAVRLPVERRGHDVGEAAQRVEVVLLVVIERRLVPEPAPHGVRAGVDLGVVRVVDQIEGRGHEASLPGRSRAFQVRLRKLLRKRDRRYARIHSGNPGTAPERTTEAGTRDEHDTTGAGHESGRPAQDRSAGAHRPGDDRPRRVRDRPRPRDDEGGRRPARSERPRAVPPRRGPRRPHATRRRVLRRADPSAGRSRPALDGVAAGVGALQPRRIRRAARAARSVPQRVARRRAHGHARRRGRSVSSPARDSASPRPSTPTRSSATARSAPPSARSAPRNRRAPAGR